MPQVTHFSRNRCTSVEPIDATTIKSTCRLQDTLTDAKVEILVRLPDLEIINATARFNRTTRPECCDGNEALKNASGIRIGAGMLKIIKGLVGETTDCKELTFMLEECCHGVILAFTKDTLDVCPDDPESLKEFFASMVKKNIRLYNRCAAFAPGSSIVEGIKPPSK